MEATLHSVLAQTCQDFELILVDDGSTDRSLEILQRWALEHGSIQLISKARGERGAARNAGAAVARGRYLLFFDSDDRLPPEHLSLVQQTVQESGGKEVYYTALERISENGEFLCKTDVAEKRFWREIHFNNFLACGSVFIREDVFRQFWFREDWLLSACEDKELWLRVASRYPFRKVTRSCFQQLEHTGRSLRGLTADRLEKQTLTLIQRLNEDDVFKKAFRYHRLIFAYELTAVSLAWTREGSVRDSWRLLCLAVSTSPLVLFTRRHLSAWKRFLSLLLAD